MTDLATLCPSCARPGLAVDRITLKALLNADGLRRGVPAQPRYCGNKDCPTVYFEGDVIFTESELTVPVYAKHPNDPAMPVCYCFGVVAGAISNGERARELRESIAREVRAKHCACEVKNPKGGCCLGDLARLERGPHSEPAASCCTPEGAA